MKQLFTVLIVSTLLIMGLFRTSVRAEQHEARAVAAPTASATTAPAPAGWKLTWSDEFNGNALDRKKWDFDRGTFLPAGNDWIPGWGNGELQFYTSRPLNVSVDNQLLHLRAIKEPYKGAQFTSGRIKSKNLFSQTYGRFEFRARLPTGKGLWPAIWLLPQDEKYGAWAASGEIDLMEARGGEPNKVLGTLHYGSKWPANVHAGKDLVFPAGQTIADFHVYALEWDPGRIRWYVDDQLYQSQDFWWSCSLTNGPQGVSPDSEADLNAWPAPFNRPFYITMNLAVGGNFGGNPDASTSFPAEMLIDYVRVYEREHAEPQAAAPKRGAGELPFKAEH